MRPLGVDLGGEKGQDRLHVGHRGQLFQGRDAVLQFIEGGGGHGPIRSGILRILDEFVFPDHRFDPLILQVQGVQIKGNKTPGGDGAQAHNGQTQADNEPGLGPMQVQERLGRAFLDLGADRAPFGDADQGRHQYHGGHQHHQDAHGEDQAQFRQALKAHKDQGHEGQGRGHVRHRRCRGRCAGRCRSGWQRCRTCPRFALPPGGRNNGCRSRW